MCFFFSSFFFFSFFFSCLCLKLLLFEMGHAMQNILRAFADSKGPDQPAHKPGQYMWPEQDMNLCILPMFKGTFLIEVTQIMSEPRMMMTIM